MDYLWTKYEGSHFLDHVPPLGHEKKGALKTYKQTILPTIEYGSIIWIDCSKVMTDKLDMETTKPSTKIYAEDE